MVRKVYIYMWTNGRRRMPTFSIDRVQLFEPLTRKTLVWQPSHCTRAPDSMLRVAFWTVWETNRVSHGMMISVR